MKLNYKLMSIQGLEEDAGTRSGPFQAFFKLTPDWVIDKKSSPDPKRKQSNIRMPLFSKDAISAVNDRIISVKVARTLYKQITAKSVSFEKKFQTLHEVPEIFRMKA